MDNATLAKRDLARSNRMACMKRCPEGEEGDGCISVCQKIGREGGRRRRRRTRRKSRKKRRKSRKKRRKSRKSKKRKSRRRRRR